jgi:hypothetical protein
MGSFQKLTKINDRGSWWGRGWYIFEKFSSVSDKVRYLSQFVNKTKQEQILQNYL